MMRDPTNPSWSVVDRGDSIEDRYHAAASSLELVGGVAVLPFLFAIVIISAKYLKEYRLLKWGTAVKATIVAEERVQRRGGDYITLHYEFIDATGTKYFGERAGLPLPETKGNSKAKRQRLMADPIALYHPGHPTLNDLYPLDMVELRYEMGLVSGEVAP